MNIIARFMHNQLKAHHRNQLPSFAVPRLFVCMCVHADSNRKYEFVKKDTKKNTFASSVNCPSLGSSDGKLSRDEGAGGRLEFMTAISMNIYYVCLCLSLSLFCSVLTLLLHTILVHSIMIQHKPFFCLRVVESVGNANNWIFI